MIKLDLNPPTGQLREFGQIALGGFPLLAMILRNKDWAPESVANGLLVLGAVMGLAAAFELRLILRPVYAAMMLLAWPIGMVISTVLLGVVFYGLFVPVGLAFRLTGRDPLDRKLDRSSKSYWRVRETTPAPASYLRLY